MHSRYATIPAALSCSCCGAELANEVILKAADKLHAAMLEVQRREGGYYGRRPAPGHKPDGLVAQAYTPKYGRWTEAQAEEAMALALQLGIRGAARQTGIPKSTLADWIRQKRDALGQHISDGAGAELPAAGAKTQGGTGGR